ncbi:aldolase/citrate lyase family protein [Mesorhizobium sp. LSJC285A00]|uniref:aldolase/citrate lyase family protein n=1 Tax=Mesorhizobium sp. LSJC285A00 TaxID=1287338 RepID=UPI0024782B11|nr:aldolase/citrate lyase family protein [Mesorhizobium sp. LSJC285A00]
MVRVNRGLRGLAADLDAAVIAGVDALVLPKTDSGEWVLEIAHAVSDLERERSLPLGRIRFLAQIETPGALQRLPPLRWHIQGWSQWRLVQKSAAVGGAQEFNLLLTPNLSVLFAARAAGLLPLGFVGSVGESRTTISFVKPRRMRGGLALLEPWRSTRHWWPYAMRLSRQARRKSSRPALLLQRRTMPPPADCPHSRWMVGWLIRLWCGAPTKS